MLLGFFKLSNQENMEDKYHLDCSIRKGTESIE